MRPFHERGFRVPVFIVAACLMAGCVQSGHYGPRGEWVAGRGFTVEHREVPDGVGELIAGAGMIAAYIVPVVGWRSGAANAERLERLNATGEVYYGFR